MKNRLAVSKIIGIFGVWLCTASAWLGYRLLFKNSELIEEVVLKPIIFVGPVLLYLNKYEVVSKEKLGFRKTSWLSILGWGGLLSLFLVGENVVVTIMKGITVDMTRYTIETLSLNTIISLATAFSEEILYRGFLLERIWNITRNEAMANIGSTLLFMLGHVGVALFQFGYRGWNLGTYLSLMLVIGCTQGLVYGRTRSVYASALAHTIWNFFSTILR